MAKANTEAKTGKTFSADVVAALLMSNDITSISMKQYELMSAFDGEKTASGFQHDFRSVLSKARDIKQRIADGEKFEPVTPSKKRSATTATEEKATPTKKAKTTPKPSVTPKTPRGKKVKPEPASELPSPPDEKGGADLDDNTHLLEDSFNDLINEELVWD